MFRLTIAGPDTHVASSLCAHCPHSPAGCCVAPPRFAWADIARVVQHGGRDFLLDAIAKKQLVKAPHGLTLTRVKGRVTEAYGSPRVAKCVFHDGKTGCTIAADRRPATCNYYVCSDVFEDATRDGLGTLVASATGAHAELVEKFVAWDERLDRYVRANYADDVPYNAAFFDDLAAVFCNMTSDEKGGLQPM